MKRSRLALTLATAAVIATGCAAQQAPAAAGAASSAATTSTAASTSGSVMTSALPSSRAAVPETPMATGSSSDAAAGFLRLARTVYPARSAAVLMQNGRAICTALRKDSSVHDEVNTLAGELNNQAMANQVVQAAIGAYCPDLKR